MPCRGQTLVPGVHCRGPPRVLGRERVCVCVVCVLLDVRACACVRACVCVVCVCARAFRARCGRALVMCVRAPVMCARACLIYVCARAWCARACLSAWLMYGPRSYRSACSASSACSLISESRPRVPPGHQGRAVSYESFFVRVLSWSCVRARATRTLLQCSFDIN